VALKTQYLVGLIGLSVIDAIIPIPIIGLCLIFLLVQRSPWFQKMVHEFYQA
jgi:hypothetical protein